MIPVIEARYKAHANYKQKLCQSTLTALRSAKIKVQQTAKHCINDHWLHLRSSIQRAADTWNIRSKYDGIKGKGTSIEQESTTEVKTGRDNSRLEKGDGKISGTLLRIILPYI